MPVFVTDTVLVPLVVFSFWLPKFNEVGDTAMDVVGAATPVPVNEIVAGEFVALLAMLTLPVAAPADVGLYTTVKVAVWPAATVTLDPTLALKPLPDAVAPEITTFEFPVFVSVTPTDVLEFTVTLPKLTLVGLAPSS
ncbi:MAG: hypothetical protein WA734_19890 [Candidatus Acidiferrales bacterium]